MGQGPEVIAGGKPLVQAVRAEWHDGDVAYFDGACEPINPGGRGSWGFVLLDRESDVLVEDCGVLPDRRGMTNNVAEYVAAGCAIAAYERLGRPGPLLLLGDSQLVVKQMLGEYAARGGAYMVARDRVLKLVEEVSFDVLWRWVPREDNEMADALSKRALQEIGVRIAERSSRRKQKRQGRR